MRLTRTPALLLCTLWLYLDKHGARAFQPSDFGLDCTTAEFVPVYLECLLTYKKEDAILNCDVQCNTLDEISNCINRLDGISDGCLTSVANTMMNPNPVLRELLFESEELANCPDLEISNVVDLCPNLVSLHLTGWSEWSEFGQCSDSCVQTRTRSCVNVISFRPPEPADGCDGDSTESSACTDCASGVSGTSTSTSRTPTVTGDNLEDAGVWTDWGEYGLCVGDCTSAYRSRSRQCRASDGQTSSDCTGNARQTERCQMANCDTTASPPANSAVSSRNTITMLVTFGVALMLLPITRR